jgi:hypothetical protein
MIQWDVEYPFQTVVPGLDRRARISESINFPA